MSASKGWPMAQLWRNDEEMAKKDDDHRLAAKRPSSHWTAARAPRRACVIRVVAYVVFAALFAVVLLQATGLDRAARYQPSSPGGRYIPGMSGSRPESPQSRHFEPHPPSRKPPKVPVSMSHEPTRGGGGGGGAAADQRKDYNGPVKQQPLIDSLRSLPPVSPGLDRSRSVLFAAASLQSAATLLPMACQMASGRRDRVHFMLAGKHDVSLREVLELNGIDSACSLIAHDARPDHAATSTDARMTLAVERALTTFHRAVHPQVILIDSTSAEDVYFHRTVRRQAKGMRLALIELPEKPQTRLAWITKLDASALAAWNKVRFDIVVHSGASGTGNLKRLLRSMARADLGGHAVPHLVVELPSTVEGPLQSFLTAYSWPPPYLSEKLMPSMLFLRRRIPRQKLTEEESSARFLESFWPSDPDHSHVLVLSPHMEVGPQFFHYIKYSLLVQRYSRAALRQRHLSNLMGLSLSVPTTILGSARPLTLPPPLHLDEANPGPEPETGFLWQAPTSDAILVRGDKWIELHGYVSQVLERQHDMDAPPALLASKEVGKQYPAWMEYALQLSRLRGYLTLYPGRQTANAIAGVHSDLPEPPEEYQGQAGTRDKEKGGDEASTEFDVASQVDMLETLPRQGAQQLLGDLPVLSWNGQQIKHDALEDEAAQFAFEFHQQVGGCRGQDLAKSADRFARDLFCRADGRAA